MIYLREKGRHTHRNFILSFVGAGIFGMIGSIALLSCLVSGTSLEAAFEVSSAFFIPAASFLLTAFYYRKKVRKFEKEITVGFVRRFPYKRAWFVAFLLTSVCILYTFIGLLTFLLFREAAFFIILSVCFAADVVFIIVALSQYRFYTARDSKTVGMNYEQWHQQNKKQTPPGMIYQTECPHCHTKMEYDRVELHSSFQGMSGSKVIICPVCDSTIDHQRAVLL